MFVRDTGYFLYCCDKMPDRSSLIKGARLGFDSVEDTVECDRHESMATAIRKSAIRKERNECWFL